MDIQWEPGITVVLRVVVVRARAHGSLQFNLQILRLQDRTGHQTMDSRMQETCVPPSTVERGWLVVHIRAWKGVVFWPRMMPVR